MRAQFECVRFSFLAAVRLVFANLRTQTDRNELS